MNNINLFNGDEINQKTILGHPSGLFTLFLLKCGKGFHIMECVQYLFYF